MTPKERFGRALRREEVDRLPFWVKVFGNSYIDFQPDTFRKMRGLELAEYLIENAGVALVPGSAFGLGGHVRLSIATSMENLTNALDRMEKVLNT